MPDRDPHLVAVADARTQQHLKHASRRPWSEGYDYVGLAGEKALAELCGRPMNEDVGPAGDDGIDNVITLDIGGGVLCDFEVDVKTARKPHNLLVAEDKVKAELYVLALFHEPTQTASLIGWQWAAIVRAAPVIDDFAGNGVCDHVIPMRGLRPMRELEARVRRPSC